MGNDCSKPCKKPKKLNSAQERASIRSINRFTPASNRETVNQYSLTCFKEVQKLANENNLNGLKKYLDTGFLVDFPLDQSGWTLLHLGCQKGNLKLVEIILKYNPYLDAQELAEGWTPLMVSVVNDFNSIFSLLIQSGADKFLKDKSGKNVFDLAQKYNSKSILHLLS